MAEQVKNKSNISKYLKIALTLSLIGGASALVIGVTNYITAPVIAKNEYDAKIATIKELYEEGTTFSEEYKINVDNQAFILESYFEAFDTTNKKIGYAFICDGRNAYGRIKLAVNIDSINYNITKILLIVNDQSYGDKLVTNFIDPFNKGERDFDDIANVGATFSATLVHDMCSAAKEYVMSQIDGGISDFEPYLSHLYGESKYIEKRGVSSSKYPTLRQRWTVAQGNGEISNTIVRSKITSDKVNFDILAGMDYENNFNKVYWVLPIEDQTQPTIEVKTAVETYLSNLNANPESLSNPIDQSNLPIISLLKDTITNSVAFVKENNIIDPFINDITTKMYGDSVTYGKRHLVEWFNGVSYSWKLSNN